MSTSPKQMDNMNNISEVAAIVGEDDSEQKDITGLNELLEQGFKEDESGEGLKEVDSVDRYIHCLMDEDIRYTSKFRLNNEGSEASVVPDSTLYCLKEGASTDNDSSTLGTQLEIPDNSEKEAALKIPHDAENCQSFEEGNSSRVVFKNIDMEIPDECTNEIKDTMADNNTNENGLDPLQNKDDSLVPEVESILNDQVSEEQNVVEQSSIGNDEEETNDIENQIDEEQNVMEQNTTGDGDEETDGTEDQTNEEQNVMEQNTSGNGEEETSGMEDQTNEEQTVMEQNTFGNGEEETNGTEDMEDKVDEEQVSAGSNEEETNDSKDYIDEEDNVEQDSKGGCEEESNSETETTEEAHDCTEMASYSETQSGDLKENEEAATSESAQDNNAMEICKGIVEDLHPPDSEKSECKESTSSPATDSPSKSIPDKPALSPVFKILRGSDAKNVKGIITARLVKSDGDHVTTMTADNPMVQDIINSGNVSRFRSLRIIKVNASPTKVVDNCGAPELTSREYTVGSMESAEAEGENHKSDEVKGEHTKIVQSDEDQKLSESAPQVILTKRVYRNIKKVPVAMPEKRFSNIAALNADTVKDENRDDSIAVSGNTEALVAEGKTLSTKSVVEKKAYSSSSEKVKTDFAAIKRKFEEVSRISKKEEETAMKEIKKMKKETLDILRKINGEMKKLESIYLAGN